MKLRKLFTLLALALIASGCTHIKTNPNPENMTVAQLTEAQDLHQRFAKAFSNTDVDALMGLYADSPDVVLYPPDEMVARGSEAIRSCLTSVGKDMPGVKLSFTKEHFMPYGDGVASWGEWKLEVPGPNGKISTIPGRFSEVLIRENGQLKILIDHASVPISKPKAGSKTKVG